MTEPIYKVLDLFAGLGGFSQAFEESELWEVTTVEIEEKFDPDIVADVFELRPSDFDTDFDVVLASPPCTLFSTAGNHDQWDGDSKEPIGERAKDHVALVHHTIGLIRGLNPTYWYVENPRGRMVWVLGEPTGSVTYCQYGAEYMKPTYLWGDHAPGQEYRSCDYGGACHTPNTDDDGTSAIASMDGLNHAERSMVPYELSKSIRDACESAFDGDAIVQASVEDF